MRPPMKPWRDFARCAACVANRFASRNVASPSIDLTSLLERDKQIGLLLEIAVERRWYSAQRSLRSERRQLLEQMSNKLQHESQNIEARQTLSVTESEILRDLMALNLDFPIVSFNKREQRLSVVTEPVELETVHLGAFKIVLDLASLGRDSTAFYEVIAVDPYPAASEEDITHPHIQGNRVCEGDAQPTIKLALRQARIQDFFQIVENLLRTYNPSSAYVKLSDWGDLSCSDCGHSTHSDDCDCCHNCESRVCDSCWCNCNACDERHCGDCSCVCSGCLDDVCKTCVWTCEECSQRYCESCFNGDRDDDNKQNQSDDNERCKCCVEKERENQMSQSHDENTRASVHSDGVGQVAVPA